MTDSPLPVMTTFAIPTALSRPVAEFLASLGLTVAHHPGSTPDRPMMLAVPSSELVAALSEVSGRYRIVHEHSTFGGGVRVIDTHEQIDVGLSPDRDGLWRPVDPLPAMPDSIRHRVVPMNVRSLPMHAIDTGPGAVRFLCRNCSHPLAEHTAVPYDGHAPHAYASVVFCHECECATRTPMGL